MATSQPRRMDRTTLESFACGVVFFALAHVTLQIADGGWTLINGLEFAGLVALVVVLFHALTDTWVRALVNGMAVIAMISGSAWWLHRFDLSWIGITVLAAAALVFATVFRVAGRGAH
jgi:hypothetical protein